MIAKMMLTTLSVACLSLALGACGYDKDAEEATNSAVDTQTTDSLVENIKESAGEMADSVEETAGNVVSDVEEKVSETMAAGEEKLDQAAEELSSDVKGETQDEAGTPQE